MKRFRVLYGLLALLVLASSADAQEVPKGVNYKRAPDSVNAAARIALENALASESLPNEFLGEVFVCGPMLWKALKPSSDQTLLGAKPVVVFVQDLDPIQAEAKSILKPEERQSFWRVLGAKYPALKAAKIRQAHADEISYYWATIAWDIEDPFFVLETNSERFVVHLQNKNGKTILFWIDLVGDFRTFKR